MTRLFLDLRYGARALLRRPGFGVAAVLTLSLGIGANIAAFSLLDHLVIGVVPFPDADRLVTVHEEMPDNGYFYCDLSAPNYLDFKENATSFSSMAVWRRSRVNLSGVEEPLSVQVARVSLEYFSTLGVHPLLGRDFLQDEDRFEGPKVAVLGHGLWQARFGGDTAVVGRSIRLDGVPHEVVGVMGPELRMPLTMDDSDADLYVPMAFTPRELRRRGAHGLWAVARLAPAVTVQAADQEIREIARELARLYPDENASRTGAVYPMSKTAQRYTRTPALVLVGVVALVLLIACSNVASLLMARGLQRRRELAIRSVIGAGSTTLFRQMLTESLLLGLLGGAGGLLVARLVLAAFTGSLPFLPDLGLVELDYRLLLFAVLVTLAATLVFGVLPAWQVTRLSPSEIVKEGARSSGGRGQHRARGALVMLEVAMATILLVAAGLLLKSLGNLHEIDPGFEPQRLLTASCVRPHGKYPDFTARRALYERLSDRISAIGQVEVAALTDTLPFGSFRMNNTYAVEGQPQPPGHWLLAFERSVSPGFFAAMGIPIVQGRGFTNDDADQEVVVINQHLADKHWPGESAVGKHISLSGPDSWRRVIGVVGNTRQDSIIDSVHGEIYKPLVQENRFQYLSFALRTSGDPHDVIPQLKRAVAEVDPDLAFYDIRDGYEMIGWQLRIADAGSFLVAGFSLLALLLAAVGLNGVISLLVGLRTREIGVRVALGARISDVMGLVLGEGLQKVLPGTVLGLVAAIGAGRALSNLLYGVSPTDVSVFLLVPLLVMVVALLACCAPVHRAATMHPTVALRDE